MLLETKETAWFVFDLFPIDLEGNRTPALEEVVAHESRADATGAQTGALQHRAFVGCIICSRHDRNGKLFYKAIRVA